MIGTIAKREFLSNLMTFKFAVGLVVTIVLMVVFTSVLLGDYQQRLESYNKAVAENADVLRQIRVYKNIRPTIYRPPEALSIFSEGVDKQVGNMFRIELDTVPRISAGYGEENPLLSVFPSLDVSLIFKIIMSVLALLFAYDLISRERQQGTLKLMLSGRAARHQVLLGKTLAGLLTLAIPITIAFIIVLLILQLSPSVNLTGSDWTRVGLIYLVSLIFISAMFNLGLLFSCLTKKSSTTLMFVLFFWVLFVVVIPNAGVYLAAQFRSVEPVEKLDGEVQDMNDELRNKIRDFVATLPPGGTESDGEAGIWGWFVKNAERSVIERKRRQYAFEEPLRIKYADKTWEVQRRYFNSLAQQKHLADHLSRSSPLCVYGNLMSALCRTDLGDFEHFVERAKNYRNMVIDYVRSKTDDFSSPSYFTVATEKEIDGYTEAMTVIRERMANGEDYGSVDWSGLDKWMHAKGTDYPPLGLQDLPGFTNRHASISASVGRALPDLALLVFFCVLFFLLSFVAFLRYDVS